MEKFKNKKEETTIENKRKQRAKLEEKIFPTQKKSNKTKLLPERENGKQLLLIIVFFVEKKKVCNFYTVSTLDRECLLFSIYYARMLNPKQAEQPKIRQCQINPSI